MDRRSFFKLIPFLPLAAKAKIAPAPSTESRIAQRRSGLKTYSELIEERGIDWREFITQRAKEEAYMTGDQTERIAARIDDLNKRARK